MFKEEYQGGTHVEIFTINAREPLKEWKLSDSGSFDKAYEKEAKGFVLLVKGSTGTTQIQLPKDPKKNLFLIQPFFLIQTFVPRLSEFYIELTVRDVRGTRRRLFFSGNQKEISSTALHARLPLSGLQQNMWTNLCIDVPSFVAHCWPNNQFHSVASILVAGTFKLRKIFTLKVPPPPTSQTPRDLEPDERVEPIDSSYTYEHLPKNCDFPIEVYHVDQLISVKSVQKHISSAPPNSSRLNNTSSAASGHIVSGGGSAINGSAFNSRTALSAGDKIPEPPSSSKRRGSHVRRMVASGPCSSSKDEPQDVLSVSGSSKSMDSARLSGNRNSRSKRGQSHIGSGVRVPSSKFTQNKSADLDLALVGRKEPILPYIEPESHKKPGLSNESLFDSVSKMTLEMEARISASQLSGQALVPSQEQVDYFIANVKSDIPKLPTVTETYSLVAGDQVPPISKKLSVSSESAEPAVLPEQPKTVESSMKAEAIALIKRSFRIAEDLAPDEDDDLDWSMIRDQSDGGPNLKSDFERADMLPKSPAIPYDAKRYTDQEAVDNEANHLNENGDLENLNSDADRNKASSSVHTSITSEQSEVELLFDPVLNCYFDPKTGKYFELVA